MDIQNRNERNANHSKAMSGVKNILAVTRVQYSVKANLQIVVFQAMTPCTFGARYCVIFRKNILPFSQ
jgi:hypothetical protein